MTPHSIDPPSASRRFNPTRILLMAAVVLCTLWAFNWHFARLADRLAAQEAISDTTNTLPPERLATLREAARAIQQAYGIELRIQVRPGPLSPPPPGPASLFIGLDTTGKTAAVQLPPLLAKALPPELARSLQTDYFAPYLDDGSWPEGLYAAVLAIMEALSDQH
ncbi:hypothetical protein NNJEOMEG_00898 [Fundidesulfovibrio magnetotacticus]|uniref:TPM domain-containing protein n=1 Tax=Fundidesulfovibrio magnetotacticus TaxID=2730080 RepID=A0A6V8LSJ6_9BACT|nr:TPM domain-containing protein [Fundidesulfovibrio magnetotacticus]GFK93069.1 hypothetical protein NNJEOMEG_00898 [Fundidesulfovibrio magnetotacticus]